MRVIAFVLTYFFITQAFAQVVAIGTFNTESASDTQPFKVAETMRKVGFVDIWALQEVSGMAAIEEYTVAAGAVGKRKSYRAVHSESGEINSQHRRNDLLAIVYNSSRFRQVETIELHGIRSRPGLGRLGEADWNLRGALFVRLHDRDSGLEFYVGNVHLKCCGEGKDIRAHQATILRDWIKQTDVPVILTGDFNIPVAPSSANGNQNSDAFKTLEEAADWLRPSNPLKTQCSPSFNSMLDLFFLKPGPNTNVIDVTVKETGASYCDSDSAGYADHRPVVAEIALVP